MGAKSTVLVDPTEHSSPQLDDWRCPICYDLLYKPCVNSCGHVSCFWCFHQCMSPYNTSKCPLCRAAFVHFPGVCRILHLYLSKAFPEEYAIRDQENRDDETRTNKHSPDLSLREEGGDDADLKVEDFTCSHVGCNKLLCKPVVLNCGHAVCRSCAPQHQEAGQEGSRPAVCSRCNNLALPNRSVCMQLDELVERLFPEPYAERSQQIADETSAAVASAAALAASASTKAPVAHAVDIVLPPAETPGDGSGSAAGSPASPSGLPVGPPGPAAESAPAAATSQRPHDTGSQLRMSILRAIRDEHTFVHHGVGCDSCGICPVIGRCYHCQDCQDHVGFDLCSACHELGLHKTGRFNQQHTPEHRMAVLKPVPNLWHILQAANPDLTLDQIMGMVEIAWQDSDHEVGPRQVMIAPTRIGLPQASSEAQGADPHDPAAAPPQTSAAGLGQQMQPGSHGMVDRAESTDDEASQPLLSNQHQAHDAGMPTDPLDLPASPSEMQSSLQDHPFARRLGLDANNPQSRRTFSGGHVLPAIQSIHSQIPTANTPSSPLQDGPIMFATHALPGGTPASGSESPAAVTPWDVQRRHSQDRPNSDRPRQDPQRAGSAEQPGAQGDGRRGFLVRRSNTALGQLQSAIGSMFRSSLARQESGTSHGPSNHSPHAGIRPSDILVHQQGSAGAQSGFRAQQGLEQPAYRELGEAPSAHHGWGDPFGDGAYSAAHPNTASWDSMAAETMSNGSAADHSPSTSDRPLLGDLIPARTFTYRQGPLDNHPSSGSQPHQSGPTHHQQSSFGVVHEAWSLQDAIPSFQGSFHQQLQQEAAPRFSSHMPPLDPTPSFQGRFHQQLHQNAAPQYSSHVRSQEPTPGFRSSFHAGLDHHHHPLSATPSDDPFTAHLLHGAWGSPEAMDGFPGSPPQSSLDSGPHSEWQLVHPPEVGGVDHQMLPGGARVQPSWFSPSTPQTRPGPIVEAPDAAIPGHQQMGQEWGPPLSPPVASDGLAFLGASSPLATASVSHGNAEMVPAQAMHTPLSFDHTDTRPASMPDPAFTPSAVHWGHAAGFGNLQEEQAMDWRMPSEFTWSDALLEVHPSQQQHPQQQQGHDQQQQQLPPQLPTAQVALQSWHNGQARAGYPDQWDMGMGSYHPGQHPHGGDGFQSLMRPATAATESVHWHTGPMAAAPPGIPAAGDHGVEDPSRELLVVEDDGTAVWHDANQVPIEPLSPLPRRAQ